MSVVRMKSKTRHDGETAATRRHKTSAWLEPPRRISVGRFMDFSATHNASGIVLKLHTTVTPAQLAVVEEYARSRDVTILFDVEPPLTASGAAENSTWQSLNTLRQALRRPSWSRVQLCEYSFKRVFAAFPRIEERLGALSKRWRPEMRRAVLQPKNFLDGPPLLILLRRGLLPGCTSARDVAKHDRRNLWSIEADAVFVGDPREFFDECDRRFDEADLLSTGFQLADGRWWAHNLNTLSSGRLRINRTSELGPLELPLPRPLCAIARGWKPPNQTSLMSLGLTDFESGQLVDYYTKAVAVDVRNAPGQCESNSSKTRSGALFRLMQVERYSAGLLDHLASLLSDGRLTVSESFASSACALTPWCVLSDWAAAGPSRPAMAAQQSRGADEAGRAELVPTPSMTPPAYARGVLPARGFRSSHFYYFPARFSEVPSWCEVCDCALHSTRQMRDGWVHPLLELKSQHAMDSVHPAMRWRSKRAQESGGTALRQQCKAHWKSFPRCATPCVSSLDSSGSSVLRLRGIAYDPLLGGVR